MHLYEVKQKTPIRPEVSVTLFFLCTYEHMWINVNPTLNYQEPSQHSWLTFISGLKQKKKKLQNTERDTSGKMMTKLFLELLSNVAWAKSFSNAAQRLQWISHHRHTLTLPPVKGCHPICLNLGTSVKPLCYWRLFFHLITHFVCAIDINNQFKLVSVVCIKSCRTRRNKGPHYWLSMCES